MPETNLKARTRRSPAADAVMRARAAIDAPTPEPLGVSALVARRAISRGGSSPGHSRGSRRTPSKPRCSKISRAPTSRTWSNSLRREGLREPIPVTPDGVIIDGHQRVRAARRLGWTHITVWVRDDLADDQVAIDRAHIDANQNRRQLDPLDEVRMARRRAEMKLGRKPGGLFEHEMKALCGRLADKMRLSRRNVQRLLNISGIPMPIQHAHSAKRLKLVDADQVSRLDRRVQQRIAEEIEAGGDPAEIVAPHLAALKRPVKAEDAYEPLMTALARGLEALEGREDQIRPPLVAAEGDLELLERFSRFHEALASTLTRHVEDSRSKLETYFLESGRGGTIDGFPADFA